MLVHIITDFSAKAGAQTMLARLLSASRDRQSVVVSLTDVSERNRRLANNPNAKYVSQHAHRILAAPGVLFRLANLIRKERPSAIVCWMYHAMVMGSMASILSRSKVPVFWNVRQSLDDPAALSRSTRMAVAAARRLSGLPRGIIYNSSRALQLHQTYGYASSNSVVIPNGFELPATINPPGNTARVFGIAGRFHPQKDYGSFFRAAGQFARTDPAIRFVAVGEGLRSDNPAVRRMMAEAGLDHQRIELSGEITDMEKFYNHIDALVLSSRTEGFPNVVAEAMSYGRPVVATDVGDAAAIVGDTGFVVPAQDPAALAAAMQRMAALPPEAYRSLTIAARRKVETEYSLRAIAERYHNYLCS